jgi:hypothetical protein
MQARVMHLIFKKFDTLGSYIAENIKKSRNSFRRQHQKQHVRGFSV